MDLIESLRKKLSPYAIVEGKDLFQSRLKEISIAQEIAHKQFPSFKIAIQLWPELLGSLELQANKETEVLTARN